MALRRLSKDLSLAPGGEKYNPSRDAFDLALQAPYQAQPVDVGELGDDREVQCRADDGAGRSRTSPTG
jgi:hypothetical protein